MTDPTFTPESDRELLAVYPDRQHAQAARTALLDAGLREDVVHLDEDLDAVASLRSEMHDEITRAWVVPNAAVAYPSGAARGLVLVSIVGALVGLTAAFPLALIDVGSTYWVRWLVFAIVGVAFGLTVALLVGPAGGAPRPGELPAAARGSLLRVERDDATVREVLVLHDPIRIDEISHEGDPIATVTPERPDKASETAKDIAANVQGDDYHPER
jgi:hypothetical protein